MSDGQGPIIARATWNRRTPGPATQAMLKRAKAIIDPPMPLDVTEAYEVDLKAFLAEWSEPAASPPDATPLKPSPWTCAVCGGLVRIADDLRPYHVAGPANHEAELSQEDMKILADNLRLMD